MTAAPLNLADHELSQAAKLINNARSIMREQGNLPWAERLTIAIDLLSAPNIQEPVLPSVPSRVYPRFQRPDVASS